MGLTLNLEAVPGDSIDETAREMCSIASGLGVHVRVKFNDVTLMSYRGGDPSVIVEGYHEACKSGSSDFKFASTRP